MVGLAILFSARFLFLKVAGRSLMTPVHTSGTSFVGDVHIRSVVHISCHIHRTSGKEGASETLVFCLTSLRYVVVVEVTDWALSHSLFRDLFGVGWFLIRFIRWLVISLGLELG